MKPPQSYDDLIQDYGDPTPFIRRDGTIRPEWEETILIPIQLPQPIPLSWNLTQRVRWIRAHRRIADRLESFFGRLAHAGLWTLIQDYCGCYYWRPQRGNSHKLSTHCWGLALDLNALECPLGGDPSRMPRQIVEAFEADGWFWGGRWSRPDPMHFQFMTGRY